MKRGKGGRTFAQRNVNEIPDGLLLSTVAAREPRRALQREEIRSEMRARSDRERSIETTGAFIFRSPGRRRIRWWFPRECKSSRVCSLSSLSALSLNHLLSLYLLLSSRVYSIALNGCEKNNFCRLF